MPPCSYVANAVMMRYQDRKLFAAGVDFDEDGVEQNWRERVFWGRFLPVSLLQVHKIFWGYFNNYKF